MPVLIALYGTTPKGFGPLLPLPWEGSWWQPAEAPHMPASVDYDELSINSQYITYAHTVAAHTYADGMTAPLHVVVRIPTAMVAVDVSDRVISPHEVVVEAYTLIQEKGASIEPADIRRLLSRYRLRPRLGTPIMMTADQNSAAYIVDDGKESRAELIDALSLCPRIAAYGRIFIVQNAIDTDVPRLELNMVDRARLTPINIVFPRRDNAPIYRRINGNEVHKYNSRDFDFPPEGFHDVEIELSREIIERHLAMALDAVPPQGVSLDINAPLAEVAVIFKPLAREKVITVRVDGVSKGDSPAALLAELEYYKSSLARGELLLSGHALVHFESMRRAYPERIAHEVHFKAANPHYCINGVSLDGDIMIVHLVPHSAAANIYYNAKGQPSTVSRNAMTRVLISVPSSHWFGFQRKSIPVRIAQAGGTNHSVVSVFPTVQLTNDNGTDVAEVYIPLMYGSDIRALVGAPVIWDIPVVESSSRPGSYEAIAGTDSKKSLWERVKALFRYRHSEDISTPVYTGRIIAEALLWVAALLLGVTVGVIYHAEIVAW